MWAYAWLVGRHLSPPWEDKDGFWGEVRARYGIKNVSAFCVFAFVLIPRPLLLLLMGDGGFGATLALLTHPNLFLFFIT